MTLTERLWRLLPDKCQVVDCSRRGVRGNENLVGGKIVCDYCYSRQGHLEFGSWWARIWRRLKPRQRCELTVMRLADMRVVHPEQITARCSFCGEEVGVYPSGQWVMREIPDVQLICQVCSWPGPAAKLAPGAELEPMQSVWKEPRR
jgi:hypothetical protein